MHVSEPYLSRMRGLGHRVLAETNRIAPGAHTSVLMYGPSMLARPELAQRFMNAYLRGSRRYSEGATPRNIAIISKRLGYDTAMLRNICLPKTRTDGELNLDWLLSFQEWAVEKGHLEKVVGRDAGVDLSFARRASAKLDAEAAGR
jgi:ABC-type nitrate/sulfonate/bicarbonate transport system substrate-binding protein